MTAALRDAGFDVAPPVATSRTILDTFDGRLFGAGLRLELAGQQDGTALALRERDGHGAAATVAVDGAPRFGDGTPPGPLRARIADVTRERALLPRVTVTGVRSVATRRDRRGKVVATAAVYSALAITPAPANEDVPALAVELAAVRGHPKATSDAADALRALGLSEDGPDLLDVAAALAGVDLRGWRTSPTVELDSDTPTPEAFSRVLSNLADAVEANVDGTADHVDPEFLHDLRVAVRRTRSVLSQGRKVLPETVQPHRAVFDWLAQVTGPARDLDVYLLEWDDYVGGLDAAHGDPLEAVRTELEHRRDAAHAEVTAALRSDRYRDGMRAWRSWLADLAATPAADADADADADAIGPVVRKLIRKAQRRVLRAGRAITAESPAEELHELRKLAKKLRYLLECFGGLLDAGHRKSFIRRLQALQDNLGSLQDAEVHADMLRSIAADLHARGGVDGSTFAAVEQLVEQLDQLCHRARVEFADRFASYDRRPTRKELADLLDALGSPA